MSMLALLVVAQLDRSASTVTLEPAPHGAALHQGSQRWLLSENEWPEAFDLVPVLLVVAPAVGLALAGVGTLTLLFGLASSRGAEHAVEVHQVLATRRPHRRPTASPHLFPLRLGR
jgi:hypothetical protein